MSKRFTDSDKWLNRFFKSLPTAYKLLWLYIWDTCNNAGIWILDFEVAQLRIGSENVIQVDVALDKFKDVIIPIDSGEKWFIPSFVDFQYGELTSNNNAHNSVIKQLTKFDLIKHVTVINEGLTSSCLGAKEKDKMKFYNIENEKKPEKTIEKFKKFEKPLISEIYDFCISNKLNINPDDFYNYYDSVGWVIGSNKPMKDWKASVRLWASKQKEKTNHQEPMTSDVSQNSIKSVKSKAQQQLEGLAEGTVVLSNGNKFKKDSTPFLLTDSGAIPIGDFLKQFPKYEIIEQTKE